MLSVGDYLSEIIRVDIPTASGVRHDPTMVRRLMQSLSLNVATEAKMTKLASDMDIGHPRGATPSPHTSTPCAASTSPRTSLLGR